MVECREPSHYQTDPKQTDTFGLKELLELREQLDLVLTQLQTVMGYEKQK